MKRLLTAAAAALLTLALIPARAAKGTVALVPAHVFKGTEENGKIVTDALRASLEGQGFTVMPADKVDMAIQDQKIDITRLVPIQNLAKLKKATGADWLVYPRVLSVGVGVNAKGEHQANILVNVVGTNPKSFAHTRQVGQTFQAEPGPMPVIPKAAAEEAAGQLLADFYAKTK
jgi:hypothetical protein